ELPALPDALHAELWVSQQLGVLASAAPDEAAFTRALADLITYLAAVRTPGAAVFLAALAAIGPPVHRPHAAKALARPIAPGEAGSVASPEWVRWLGSV